MGVSPRTTPSDGVEASQLTAIIEHLTQPVFLFAPVFDGEHVVSLDRTSEHAASAQFRTVVDMIAQPLHVHAPVFDDSGRIVDTTILFAN